MAEQDIRDIIFDSVKGKKYVARISAQAEGILSGIERLKNGCERIGLRLIKCRESGVKIKPSGTIATLEGDAKRIALGEEELIGWISKASGIATAAGTAKKAAGTELDVVCGAWKKMPLPIKDLVREAIVDGGIRCRIADQPFLYMDKNYVKVLGGVGKTMRSIDGLKGRTLVIQIKGAGERLLRDAVLAAKDGADIIMIDTGRQEDIERIDTVLRSRGLRDGLRMAFGGNVGIDDLRLLRDLPVDIVDIGQAVVDAPLLDMRMDIIARI